MQYLYMVLLLFTVDESESGKCVAGKLNKCIFRTNSVRHFRIAKTIHVKKAMHRD
jgi:hypothetical protein